MGIWRRERRAGRAQLSYTQCRDGRARGARRDVGRSGAAGGEETRVLLEQRNRERGCAETLPRERGRGGEGNACGREGGRPGPRHGAVLSEGSRARLGSARLRLLPPAARTAFLGHPANVNEARFLCM